MKILLYDINEDLIKAWAEWFKNEDNVEVKKIAFEDVIADYVVTAGNSYGWMTGGIDLAVRNYFGQQIQDKIQAIIISDFNGYLPVGEIIYVYSGYKDKPYVGYIPTMSTPKQIYKEDVYYVASKIFRSLIDDEKFMSPEYKDKVFAICGLGTLTGQISPSICAEAMYKAYKDMGL